MSVQPVAWSASVAKADGIGPTLECEEGRVISGLFEDTTYVLRPSKGGFCKLFVDDVAVPWLEQGFVWQAGFFAGQVSAVFVEPDGKERTVWLDVGPAPGKLSGEDFAEMVETIRRFDNRLLLGTSAATSSFGRIGLDGRLTEYVRLSRLLQYGQRFLDAIRKVTEAPHEALASTRDELPLSRVRRLSASAFRDRHLVALALGYAVPDADVNAVRIRAYAPVVSVDTPANRALLALLKRFAATVRRMAVAVETMKLGSDAAEDEPRQARRLEVLRSLQHGANALLRRPPFSGVTRAETSSAGLTQVSALPIYASAYRWGAASMSGEIGDKVGVDALHISPSWGVYETWCYVKVVELVGQFVPSLRPAHSVVAIADLTLAGELRDGTLVEVLLQPTFPAVDVGNSRLANSLSRERRPDIAIACCRGGTWHYVLLDAKYRGGRANVLDAMASAHIYHDSLRVGSLKPELALLLLPGPATVKHLDEPTFWREHHIGTASGFSVDSEGTMKVGRLVEGWLSRTHQLGPL
jgi:hypothetical protein